MLHNEFDRFFKDRLKDYSSPVHTVIWRRVRSDWGRRQLFRTRWGLTGGAAVVVVAVVIGYFIVRPGKPMVGRAAAVGDAVEASASRPAGVAARGAAGVDSVGAAAGDAMAATAGTSAVTGTDSATGAGTSHFAKSIAAGAVELSPASSTGRVSGRPPRRNLSQGGAAGIGGVSRAGGMGGAEGVGQAAGGTGVGGRKADGVVAGQEQGRAEQRGAGRGRVEQGRRGARQSQESGDRVPEGQGAERQGYRGEGLGHRGLDQGEEELPSLAQLSSRAAIYAKPIKLSPVVSSRQRSGAALDDRPGNLHLDIYGSPDIPTKQFALSYTAGARMTMLITRHFFVSAGLQYSKANVKKDSATALLYPRYFNNIDLPVLIGYTTGNDRFRFSVDGGVIFNLFSHAVSPVGWGWPNRTGPSAYLGLDFARAVSDRLSLFAEPYGRCLFTDYKSLFPSLTYTGGALIGIRYNFMRR